MIKPFLRIFLKLALCFFLYSTQIIIAQDSAKVHVDPICQERDLSDAIREALNKPPKIKTGEEGSLLLLPIIQSNPATGFAVGVGGQYAFKALGSKNYSLLMGSIQYTTKNQFIFLLKNSIYTKNERIFLSGDWRYLIYSQATYGLGTNSPEGGIVDYQYNMMGMEVSTDSLAEQMKFNFGRLHQSVGFKIAENIYLGLGYKLDSYKKIEDNYSRSQPEDSINASYHSGYNKYYGFDTKEYFNSALNVNFVIDKRDNMIRAFKGYYLSVNWQGGFKFTGNDRASNQINVEWRSFRSLSKRDPSHLLALWVLGDFAEEGSLPYMVLPATAYDQRGRSARGYTQGRFRGNNMVYSEVEYRFPISQCGGILGGVVFVNATTTNNPFQELRLFQSIMPSYGFGLRIKVDKYSRTNLAIDIGFGKQTSGFYLAASEAF